MNLFPSELKQIQNRSADIFSDVYHFFLTGSVRKFLNSSELCGSHILCQDAPPPLGWYSPCLLVTLLVLTTCFLLTVCKAEFVCGEGGGVLCCTIKTSLGGTPR